MGIIDKTKQAIINGIASQVVTVMSSQQFKATLNNGGFLYNALSYSDSRSFAEKGYNGNLYVNAVVSSKAGMLASVPWIVYEVKEERKAKHYAKVSYHQNKLNKSLKTLRKYAFTEVDGTEANELLEQPNSMQGAKEYNEGVFAMKEIAGETFELGLAPDEANPERFIRMYQLYPWDVEVKIGDSFLNPIDCYKLLTLGQGRTIPVNQILHQKYFNPMDFWRGLSPIQAGVHAVLENTAQQKWGQALAENNGNLPGVLNFEGLQDGQAAAIKEKIREQKVDFDGAGLPVVTSGTKGQWLQMAMTQKDAESLNRIKLTAEQISLMFKWPAELVSGDKKFNNFEMAMKWAWTSSLIPALDDRRDELNRFHHNGLLEGGRFYIDYDVSQIEALQPDLDKVSTRVQAEWRSNLITYGEARERLNYDVDPTDPMNNLRFNEMQMIGFGMAEIERDIINTEKAIKELLIK